MLNTIGGERANNCMSDFIYLATHKSNVATINMFDKDAKRDRASCLLGDSLISS
jgi:hypothetical protein